MEQKKPLIIAVDDDPQVIRSIERDLLRHYQESYEVLATDSAEEILESLSDMKKSGDEVALFLSDQRMPGIEGVDFLERTKTWYPNARKVLLTAYSDKDAAIDAINKARLDYYMLKPWNPPEEKLYPVLDDLLQRWDYDYIPDVGNIKVIGYQYDPASHAIKDFLSANLFPYQWLDVASNSRATDLLELHEADESALPIVILDDGELLARPSMQELAKAVHLNPEVRENNVYDVAIIGAGPGGLAAAVYGASEGLDTLLIEKHAPGGQAGTSSRIENYLGFPNGLSGADLTHRAISQARRFGAEFLSPQEVTEIVVENQYKTIKTKDGSEVHTKAIVITTGVNYRKLDAPGVEDYTGAGIYYGAAMTEANACSDKEVYIVGGGNSAGQGAVYLANFARQVYIVIRSADLSHSMSDYLIKQLEQLDNVTLVPHTEVKEAYGDDHQLTHLALQTKGEECRKVEADSLFIFIGARPYTEWIGEKMLRDDKGYLLTGRDIVNRKNYRDVWKMKRSPYLLETCVPGIFAAGDVRSGAMNRVASAVGEGAMSIKFVHEYLGEV